MGIWEGNSLVSETSPVIENNFLLQQEIFSASTKSSLAEDIEFCGGILEEEEMDTEPAPKIQFSVTNESRNGSAGKSKELNGDLSTNKQISVQGANTSTSFLVLFLIFGLSLLSLVFVYARFPNLEESEKTYITIPRSIEDAKILGDILSRYRDKYYFEVLSGVFAIYIFLQTFAIPGSIFLSIMSGFLFSFPVALLLICFCSATGASFCYVLSFLVGRKVVYKYFPEKAEIWAQTVDKHRDNLLSYIIFLRVTPFLPNWFINITSPVINVPIIPFWIGTFIGVAPPSFVAVQAGTTLHKLSSSSDAVSWTSVVVLIGLGFLVLIPAIFKDKLKSKFE